MWWPSTTTPGASTSWPGAPTGTSASATGTLPDQSRDETDFWRPDLPGRRGFDFAKAALDSKVEPVVADFQKVDLDELGRSTSCSTSGCSTT